MSHAVSASRRFVRGAIRGDLIEAPTYRHNGEPRPEDRPEHT